MAQLIVVLQAAVFSLASLGASASPPSLDLTLEGPRELALGTETIKITGPFAKAPDGRPGLAVGRTQNVLRIPAHTIMGETGTIMFTFMSRPVKPENMLLARIILVLRGEGRERITFGQPGASQVLQFSFRRFTDPHTFQTPAPIEFDRWYQVACTWDGALVKLFLDGVLQTEFPQPYVPKFPAGATFLYFGPYVDGYTNPAPWNEDSCLIRDVKVYKQALPPEAIMAAAGRKVVDASQAFKSFLAVPHVATPARDRRQAGGRGLAAGIVVHHADRRVAARRIAVLPGQQSEILPRRQESVRGISDDLPRHLQIDEGRNPRRQGAGGLGG